MTVLHQRGNEEGACQEKKGASRRMAETTFALDQIGDQAVRWEGMCRVKHVRYKQETAELGEGL